ncbi:MAG: DUF5995 family protein [Porticoccus sp.]|nr:DUF5995 family protein [Porticoccus sp.]
MPANSIDEVISIMNGMLDRWEAEGDYRAVFALSYRTITIGMKQAILNGEFDDSDWMERLDILFAQEYFDAVSNYNNVSEDTPKCWRVAFDVARDKRTTALQDLTIGMVAHIVHDLPLALFKSGIVDVGRDRQLSDHEVANHVLGELIDQVQDDISKRYSLVLGFMDNITGNHDETFTESGIRALRAQAWKDAVALTDARDDTRREQIRVRLDQDATTMAKLMLPKPPGFLERLIPPFRRWDRALARLFG